MVIHEVERGTPAATARAPAKTANPQPAMETETGSTLYWKLHYFKGRSSDW